MRREHARYRFLLKELEAFTGVYRHTTESWFVAFTSDPSHVTDQEHGYRHIFPEQVLARIEGFDTPKQLFKPFDPFPQPAHFFLPYRDKVLTPFNDEMERRLATWWQQEWRRQHLDFTHIPPAPSTRPNALTPCGFRTWRYTDQLLVRIEGGMRTRRCQVSTCTGYVIWSFPLPPAPLRMLAQLLLPRLYRLAALTDWRQLEQLPPKVRRALSKRVTQLIAFYAARPLQTTPLPFPSHKQCSLGISQQSMQRSTAHE